MPAYCAQCGDIFRSDGITAGYATRTTGEKICYPSTGEKICYPSTGEKICYPSTGEKICYPCAGREERIAMRTAEKYSAYLNSDGRLITTWTGITLASVIHSTPCVNSFARHDKAYRSIRAIGPDGSHWAGRGSPGMLIHLKRVKS